MDTPKPHPRRVPPTKQRTNPRERQKRTHSKNVSWVVTMPHDGDILVQASSEIDAIEKAHRKFGDIPLSAKQVKKPFERRDHLTDRPFKDLKKMMGMESG